MRGVLGSTEVQWKDLFAKDGQTYRAPQARDVLGLDALGLRRCAKRDGAVLLPARPARSISTRRSSSDLERRFRGCSGKACEFAQAYVIAHEVGHHVQNLLGILPKVQQAQQRLRRPRRSRIGLQVRVELQADCFAGVWAHHAEQRNGSSSSPATSRRRCRPRPRSATTCCSSARRAMSCRTASPTARPSSASAGSSTGFKEGTVKACNTFAAASL